MEFFYEALPGVLSFGLKALIVVVAILISSIVPLLVIRKLGALPQKKKKLKIENLKKKQDAYVHQFQRNKMNKKEFKKYLKQSRKSEKQKTDKASLFVLSFSGDIMASEVKNLREEISLVLRIAQPKDEVALLLNSGGGSVPHYGLAANQLQRLRNKNIPLTICVDKVAGSGGYLMACVGNQILASPFAFIGSIGVLAGIPNVHELLKKHDIHYEEFTAGKYKRTVTPLGKITEEKRERFKEQIQLIHQQFKNFVKQYRDLNLEEVATGEAWLAEEALKKGLVDKLQCSDDFLLEKTASHNVYKISLESPKGFMEQILNRKSQTQQMLQDFLQKDFII